MSYSDYDDRKSELKTLAFIDEADSYEVDENGIYTDGEKFYLLSASGCSCWDGEFDEVEYNSFEELKQALLGDEGDGYRYCPSLEGARQLIKEAEEALGL